MIFLAELAFKSDRLLDSKHATFLVANIQQINAMEESIKTF